MLSNESILLSQQEIIKPIRLLFLSNDNGCRSQMAEGLVRAMKLKGVDVKSAGIIASGINPLAISVMHDLGIDIMEQHSKVVSVQNFEEADIIVTLSKESDQRCPPIPAGKIKYFWPILNPGLVDADSGSDEPFRACIDSLISRLTHLFEMESITYNQELLSALQSREKKESSL